MYYFIYGIWPKLKPSEHATKIIYLSILCAVGICGLLLIIKGVLL